MMLGWLKLQWLAAQQDAVIFKPEPSGILPMESPRDYGLLDVNSQNIRTEDNLFLKVWHRKPDAPHHPTFICFHGNTGHWGDVGAPQKGDAEEYDRRYRIKLLEAIAAKKAGFLAYTPRGYGKSMQGKPSEAAFEKDLAAVARYALHTLKLDPNQMILFGESLGAALAFKLAQHLTEEGAPPAMVATVAAFSSILAKARDLHPDLPPEGLAKKLRHHFDILEMLPAISKKTHLFLTHPAEDATTPTHHLKEIADAAKKQKLTVTSKEIPGGHITWEAEPLVKAILAAYAKRKLTS